MTWLEEFLDIGNLPKREQTDASQHRYANLTNLAYPIASIVLLYGTATPVLAFAVTLPGMVSTVYHAYVYSGENVGLGRVLMILDMISIVLGISLGLGYNYPAPSPGWITVVSIMAWEAGALGILKTTDHEHHYVWHILSVVPVILYAWLDLGETTGKTSFPENIESIALGFMVTNLVVWALGMWQPVQDWMGAPKNSSVRRGISF